jgi:hypothetical protein
LGYGAIREKKLICTYLRKHLYNMYTVIYPRSHPAGSHEFIFSCIYIWTYIQLYMHIRISMCIYTYVYIYIYIYIYIYKHIYMKYTYLRIHLYNMYIVIYPRSHPAGNHEFPPNSPYHSSREHRTKSLHELYIWGK